MRENVKEILVNLSSLVEPTIKEILTKSVEPKNADLAFYQCSIGGKRIRPALVIVSGQVFGAKINDLLFPAASIEIMHNGTLIVDDIIDHADLRRNQPTCWNKYGKSIAECNAIVYFASVFAGLAKVNNGLKLVDLYGSTLKVIVDGEIKDVLFERSGREDENYVVENRYKIITTDNYFDMIGQKTAILFKASCMAGAIVADASDEQTELMGEFGYNLGMAFQLRDDTLDIFGDEKEFGKKVGKDIIEKKMGDFIILTAMNKLEPADREIMRELLEGPNEITADDIITVTKLIEKTDAREVTEKTANLYIKKAFTALAKLPQNKHTEELGEIANYIVGRTV